MSKEVKNTLKTILTYAVLILMALVMLVPFAWMISASLKLEKDVFSYPIVWIPKDPVWSNYQEIWKKVPLLQGFFNTTKLTVCTTVLQLLTSSFAAYAFAKLEFKGRDLIFMLYVMTIAIPWQVYMVPQYKMMTMFHLTDSHLGLILMQCVYSNRRIPDPSVLHGYSYRTSGGSKNRRTERVWNLGKDHASTVQTGDRNPVYHILYI